MATRGPKPTATVVKLAAGNPGRRPLPKGEPLPTGRPVPPLAMSGRQADLWAQFVAPAWWLTEFDAPAAWLWCQLQAEAEANPTGFLSARIGQLRGLYNELGLTPSARTRLGSTERPADESDAVVARYLGA